MESERVEVTPPPRPVFSREQKVGYAVVIGCGMFAVVLGFMYMGTHLNAPFAITYRGDRILTSEQRDAEKIAAQKKADTDGDSINDYDELYVYQSSPYLADSDSDGQSDDTEINNGGDPTCALGADCADDVDDVVADAEFTGDYAAQAAQEMAQAEADLAELKASLANVSVAEIRVMLIESGAEQAQIDAMTDEEVTALYQQIINQLETSGALQEIVSPGDTTSTP